MALLGGTLVEDRTGLQGGTPVDEGQELSGGTAIETPQAPVAETIAKPYRSDLMLPQSQEKQFRDWYATTSADLSLD
ncbi:unnamed protein product, partial [marine sediment metagenome]